MRDPSDADLRLWPMSMEPHYIDHLTSFRAEEKLRMYQDCYDETTGELCISDMKGKRTRVEHKAMDELRQWDLDTIVKRSTGKTITCADIKRIMGPRGLGIGTREDGKPLRKNKLLARLRPHWDEANGRNSTIEDQPGPANTGIPDQPQPTNNVRELTIVDVMVLLDADDSDFGNVPNTGIEQHAQDHRDDISRSRSATPVPPKRVKS